MDGWKPSKWFVLKLKGNAPLPVSNKSYEDWFCPCLSLKPHNTGDRGHSGLPVLLQLPVCCVLIEKDA
ncbi:MAG: hypothetical protein LBG74_00425 [Spirochaetaceae bacterium]|jgi:hypothetical protein|nr:hypothetical protein [Spirochaetaceae bacterium]